MAVNWADNVEETTTSTGTGTVDLAGATAGNQTFVAGIGTTNTCYYCISSNSEYEVGYGTVTDAATDTLSRDSVLASSNSDALVSFSAGTKNVHLLPPFAIRSTRILDRDRDTKVDTDEGFADEDTIRFDAAGSEMMPLDASNGLKVGSSLEAAITNNGKFRGPDATVGGPTFSFVNDDDTGIYRPGSGQIGFVSNGTERVHIDSNGALFIGDTANAKMTIGLTINQGSNDNEILTFKSGDVNQAYTGATEADTFAVFAKETGAGGGLSVRAFADGNANTGNTLNLRAFGTTDASTSASTSARSCIEVDAHKQDGLGEEQNMEINELAFGVKGRVSNSSITIFAVDKEGDFHYDGANGGAFDNHVDHDIVCRFNDFLGTSKAQPDFKRMEHLADLKLIGRISPEEWAEGVRPLVNGAQLQRLHTGWMCQAHMREQVLWTALANLVPGFKEMSEGLSTDRNIGALPAEISK